MSEISQPSKLNLVERGLIWLSTADSEVLRVHCPKWERLKYAAFGASLLVPFLFGMIAASYAVSTLTENKIIIVGFAIIWGFIIITIDRVLLATYRAFIPFSRKMMQFFLRITVAVLMGLTVSHPLTLMLFKDTINSEIEKERASEMAAARSATDAQKQDVNSRIATATQNLQALQQRYQEVIAGGFLNAPAAPQGPTPQQQTQNSQFADLDAQIKEYKNERDQVQQALSRWQKVYDDEISGARTGKPGIGPNARAIERDELVWRREQVRELGKVIGDLTAKRTALSSKLLADSAAANAKIEASRREFEEQKLNMFKNQQGDLLAVIKGQIDSASAELTRLRTESEQITDNTIDRVDSLKEEKRADLMVQTMVLHHLFKKEGGGFALAVYVVIAGLFTLIDTIPLVVKFFSVPGIYDYHQECKEKLKEEESKIKSSSPEDHFMKDKDLTVREVKEQFYSELQAKTEIDSSLTEMEALAKAKLDLIHRIERYEPELLLEYHPERDKLTDPEQSTTASTASTEEPEGSSKALPERSTLREKPSNARPDKPLKATSPALEREKVNEQLDSVEAGKVVPFKEPAPGQEKEDKQDDTSQEVSAVNPQIKVGDSGGKRTGITRSAIRKTQEQPSPGVKKQSGTVLSKKKSVLPPRKTEGFIKEAQPTPESSKVEESPPVQVSAQKAEVPAQAPTPEEPATAKNDFVEDPGFGGESSFIADQLKDVISTPRKMAEQATEGGLGFKPTSKEENS